MEVAMVEAVLVELRLVTDTDRHRAMAYTAACGKICYSCRDIELFLWGCFFLAHPVHVQYA